MTPLITFEKISLAFGLDQLLDNVKLQINSGERVCIIGRNGAGKSSLLKIIEGFQLPDSGIVWRNPGLRIARLPQELPYDTDQTVYDYVADGLAETGKLLARYHQIIAGLESHTDDSYLATLEELQNKIDACNGWHFEQDIKSILTRLELPADKYVSEFSGGWQRRIALAKALVVKPDLLLLDEPTNHLDIEAIQWLESQLNIADVSLVFITHDRALLKRLATRIIELDRGNCTSWSCNYENYLIRKEALLQEEAKHNADFDKKLAQEEVWIRQGIKARRTRNEGRVRALKSLRNERSKRREVQGNASFSLNEAEKSGQLVIEAKNISHKYDDEYVIKNFSLRIMRGDRIGLIGPNGVGKSTLLNILLKKIEPQEGTVRQGTNLQVSYFDQLRQSLDLEKTVFDNVSEGKEMIDVNGKQKHVISYLSDFLFTPQRARTPVKALSGGECNRLLLAKLFSQPNNLLMLDEPTNDLDIETLELLEELLSNYQGTLLIVSHDREFLDNIVTSSLVFSGRGKIEEFVGGYSDWQEQIKNTIKSNTTDNENRKSETKSIRESKKLTNNEQRELENIPKQIEKLEVEQQLLQEKISAPTFYQNDQQTISNTMTRLQEIETSLENIFQRWEELESRK